MISIFVDVADKFGVNTKEAERFFKFAVVGFIGFIVDFTVFNLLLHPFELLLAPGTLGNSLLGDLGFRPDQKLALARVFASTISFVSAIISNFLWNRYWTYPDSRSRSVRRQLALFSLVSVVGILVRTPIITYTHTPFSRLIATIPALEPYATRLGDNMALMLGVIIVMFWNFFVNRYWTYNDVSS